MRASGVYAILNLFDGKIYIGSAKYIKSRFGWHHRALENNKHHNILLKRAWDKYGEDSFKGIPKSDEWKAQMSEYHKNRPASHKANHAAAMKKRGITPEHKQKLKEANMKRGYKYVD